MTDLPTLQDCPECGENDWKRTVFNRYRFECKHCGNTAKEKEIQVKEVRSRAGRTARDRTRRSQRDEKRSAAKLGARQVAGSGNRLNPSGKSDFVLQGWLRSEHKETESSSFALKLSELDKIEREARATGLRPAFHINFVRSRGPDRTYVVLQEDDFAALMAEVTREDPDD